MDSSSVKSKLCCEYREDRLSSLHESVVSRILSYLPTIEAVRTSVLSKTWRKVWTNITDLEFDDRRQRAPGDNRFIEFVEHVLRENGSPYINSFSLQSVNSYDETLLITWLSRVLKLNLQRLVITWYEPESINFSPLFSSLGSLVELRLRTKNILDISAPALLPNLKFLTLEDARIFNMSSVSKDLFLTFPVLETFEASYCCCFRTDTIIINSPLLRIFEMFKCCSEHVPNGSGVCQIRVLASKLDRVSFSGNSRKILLSFPPSLPDAYLALTNSHWSLKFLNSFTCVRSLGLELSKDCVAMKVPKFRNLVHLHLIYDTIRHSNLRKFLISAPMLKMLSIRDLARPGLNPDLLISELLHLKKKVPRCVRTTLRVLQINNFNRSSMQLAVVRYVMENAEVLGHVILSTTKRIRDKDKAEVMSFPKVSSHVFVNFE